MNDLVSMISEQNLGVNLASEHGNFVTRYEPLLYALLLHTVAIQVLIALKGCSTKLEKLF
jgi:hypothetical protein